MFCADCRAVTETGTSCSSLLISYKQNCLFLADTSDWMVRSHRTHSLEVVGFWAYYCTLIQGSSVAACDVYIEFQLM